MLWSGDGAPKTGALECHLIMMMRMVMGLQNGSAGMPFDDDDDDDTDHDSDGDGDGAPKRERWNAI